MRTFCCSGRLMEGGLSAQGGLPGGCLSMGRCLPRGCLSGGVHLPQGQTNIYENIIFPQLLLQMVKIGNAILISQSNRLAQKHSLTTKKTYPEIDSTNVYRKIIENQHHTSIMEASYYFTVFIYWPHRSSFAIVH